MKMTGFASALAIVAFTASTALAAPCNTGSTKGKTPEDSAMQGKSSAADNSSKNLAGGQQPASPGTVGAMNNAGANQGLGEKQGSMASNDKSSGADGSSKNLAGGQQPASPGTVGAMNNAGADQKLGKAGDDC